MESSVLACCLWVLAASGTAMLPMRRQMLPGLALLASAPVLIAWLGVEVRDTPGGVEWDLRD